MIGGVATDVFGVSCPPLSSVMVAPVVTSDVVTGPGGAGSGVSAPLTSLKVTVSAPIASTAVVPAVADSTLNRVVFTSDHPNSVPLEQLRRGRPPTAPRVLGNRRDRR